MLSRRAVVAFLLGLGACASNTAQRSPAAPRTPGLEFSLSLQAQLKGESEVLPLDPEGVLHSGDQISLILHLGSPAFLYVLRKFESEPASALLAIQSIASPVQPNEPIYVPTKNDWLMLDGPLGLHSLLVLASSTPLTEARIAELLPALPLPGPGRERPPTMTDRNRTGQKWRSYASKPVADQIVGLKFVFQLQP